jgi:Subtilase family
MGWMPMNNTKSNKTIAVGAGIVFSLALSACGGGSSSGGPQPIPIAPITPTPAPTPPPSPPPPPSAPASSFNTAEYRRSSGPEFHNAVTAYQTGATGQGVTVGVIDSGIDPASHEFTGRISSQSFDATGAGRLLADEDGHGTSVARVIAAAKDDRDTHGIAYNATILALRADTAGSCTTPKAGETEANCGFSDRSIANGINRATDAGARVINISLGGAGGSGSQLLGAVDRATKAGIIIVISAGNEGNDDEPKYDPLNPSPFSQSLLAAGNGLVIISTSVDAQSVISDFSNKAGVSRNSVLSALGSKICCEYKDDTINRFTENGQNFVRVSNGTSFSAPQISGAAALLAQAFPNLTGAQIVNLLLTTARDVGAVGTDEIYGRGILDIARAFAPQGTTKLAGSAVAVPLDMGAGTTSAPMGDAGRLGQAVGAVILDEYSRAYDINLAYGIQASAPQQRLAPALAHGGRGVRIAMGPANLAFSISDNSGSAGNFSALDLAPDTMRASRVLASRVAIALSKNTRFSLGIRQAAAGQIASLQDRQSDTFIAASDPSMDSGLVHKPGMSLVLRQTVAGTGISGSAETGTALIYQQPSGYSARNIYDRYRYDGLAISADRSFGPLQLTAGVNWLGERKTVLGALFAGSFGQNGAQSLFANANIQTQFSGDWQASASWRQGWTWANRSAIIANGSLLKSNAFSFDVTKKNMLLPNDKMALRVAQPLRVTNGGIALNLPVAYDYSTQSATQGLRRLNLAPKGQEIVSELSWMLPLDSGTLSTNLYWRQEPGHFQNAPDDIGIAFRFSLGF